MIKHPYSGRTAALATRHGKQVAIAPPLRDALELDLVLADIDTDLFGTFAGEVPRLDTPLNTAIAKAGAGIASSGLALGLASEGTIGPDPRLPFLFSDLEVIVFIDTERDIVIAESWKATNVIAFRAEIHPHDNLQAISVKADFPRHGLIVRSHENSDALIFKGITDDKLLATAVAACHELSGKAIIESDLRANYSPSRMAAIAQCATRLATRVATLCPECSCPGWGHIEPGRGLPCSECGTFVESAIRSDRYGCASCSAEMEKARTEQSIDPKWCPACNP